MSNSDERRWQQRLDTFGTALAQLTNACDRERYDYLELAGLIKTFEFSFESSWKVLKDLLFYEGRDAKTPRAVIRKSFEVDYIDESDCETLLDAVDKRNLLSHAYLLDVAEATESLIKEHYHPVLLGLHRALHARRPHDGRPQGCASRGDRRCPRGQRPGGTGRAVRFEGNRDEHRDFRRGHSVVRQAADVN
ncbi:MAG: nucleotidyltransferase substrate binding protein [Gemmatimonadota bacterium]|nr:nucleotidyltransferase substrate binding protein [Gemmatimonadota bacterium]MDE2986163.1 nucleotidyltransferase substrate binding protein [Gemmatimonadota bacterium]